MTLSSANFDFLSAYDAHLVTLAALAERYFRDDPNTCLIKLRQFGEALAQQIAARSGLLETTEETQADLLRRLKYERAAPADVFDLFHQLRVAGNRATHENIGDHREALSNLKIARQLAIWFHRTFGPDPKFNSGPFVPPPDPDAATHSLREELERLRTERDALLSEAERAQEVQMQLQLERESAQVRAEREAEERELWANLAEEAEREKLQVQQKLIVLQAQAAQITPSDHEALLLRAREAARHIDLDEAATRALIDQQLRDRGWETDTEKLRYATGARPAKNRYLAIAEWPTDSGPADYALFSGMKCIAIIEAKRQRKNVSAAIDQAERYSRGMHWIGGAEPIGGPWGDYQIPFVFATNGRPYLKQLETESGIWFRDVRLDTNRRRALSDWFTPEGLISELEINREVAHEKLKDMPYNFGFPLRWYQRQAIENIEAALERDQRAMLLAMATGTGKTKLAIALLYRLLTAKRFRRVCFVVDRSALGTQAGGEFATTKIVGANTFADIFNLMPIDEIQPDPETKVHICTIQGLVRRVLYADDPADVPPIDQYDLLVIDECHRGYLLDREMSDAELSFRNQEDYISKYRRVLEHFDAVKIGLTATPALHTVDIFGDPIFTYSYREAVVDGYLIDHEPPIQITTALAQAGIVFERGEEMEVLDPRTGAVDLIHAPDEISFQVEGFNRKVITVPFNRTVAEELARHIDPDLPGKTLIFAVTDAHADIVVEELKQALEERYGEIEDAAVRKITGSVDRVPNLIRSFRNDALPKIAITVDLLTTGIDVPSITNLVFIRRVNSRILYEQMLGRATRLCEEIGKETFRIFDAVDLYPHLQNLTDMRPVVVNPNITLEQLWDELILVDDDTHREAVREQIIVKLRHRLDKLSDEARQRYEAISGETPEQTLERLTSHSSRDTAQWARTRPGIGRILDWTVEGESPLVLPISHHPDAVVSVTRGYGKAEKPQDFLDSFTSYIRNNVNKITALTVVVQRPRELTRAQLRELRLELDRYDFSEVNLRRAWYDTKNEDIAASIIGFIRQAALGDALIPYEGRVRSALRRILAKQAWTDPQRKWLERIAEQIQREIVVDRESMENEPFQSHGGFRRLNKVFDGHLETVLSDFNEELWRESAAG
ncbi:MAG: type I restriction-modification system endonuclease [Chloroflexi bacterium]|nr:type I restriction-modification system endonuclease [Chloroflexota bacterium]